MKANELRIGNLILVDGEISEITGIKKSTVFFSDGFQMFIAGGIEPIPLTEEWLQDFEFHYEGEFSIFGSSYTKGGIELTYAKATDGIVILCKNVIGMNLFIDHVHQLQNLYFALTGEELTIDNEKTK